MLKAIIFAMLFLIGIIFLLIAIVILSMGSAALIGAIQEKLFLPQDYIMWIFKSPLSRLVYIYELYIILGFFYIFNKDLRCFINSYKSFIKKHKISILLTFATFNIILLYTVLYNVAAVTNNKIINYTFLSPYGKEYGYNDIVKIDTGVYGKKLYLPFAHIKGDFYYIIQLNDGAKIDLTEIGGAKNGDDHRFIIEKLDTQYVNMGIRKVSSMDNFVYCTQHLDKIYTDKIRNILLNIK